MGVSDIVKRTGMSHLGSVHLIHGNDELTDTESKRQESVFTSLTILGNTSLKFTSTSGNNKNGTISLRGTGNHVFDEVTVSGGINDLSLGSAENFLNQILVKLTVTMYLGVSNFQRAMSMVIPRSRSAFSLSRTQANKNDSRLLTHAQS